MLHYWNQQCYIVKVISLSTTLVTQNKTASGGSYHFGCSSNQDDGRNFGLVPPPAGSLGNKGKGKPSQ